MFPDRFSKARARHLRLGEAGEKLARRLLKELGITVLCKNYRSADSEIDIVARDQYTLCFVEVKTRRRLFRGRPADAVGTEKQARIIRAAHRYLRELRHPAVVYRFDIIEIVKPGRFRLRDVRYHVNAFTEKVPEP